MAIGRQNKPKGLKQMKKELQNTSQLVKAILEQDERARDSDSFLYFRVLGVLGLKFGVNVYDMTVSDFLLNRVGHEFPAFETVRRTRQKVQQQFPELAGSAAVGKMRSDREKGFREFARGDAV